MSFQTAYMSKKYTVQDHHALTKPSSFPYKQRTQFTHHPLIRWSTMTRIIPCTLFISHERINVSNLWNDNENCTSLKLPDRKGKYGHHFKEMRHYIRQYMTRNMENAIDQSPVYRPLRPPPPLVSRTSLAWASSKRSSSDPESTPISVATRWVVSTS